MASNLKYPEDSVLYFIRGDQLGLVTTFLLALKLEPLGKRIKQ